MMETNRIYQGDSLAILKTIPDESVDCIITSPPYYGLRDYGIGGQLGLEKTLDEYLNKLLAITAECKRVLKKTGTLWWNHGDSYGGGVNNNDAKKIIPKEQFKIPKNEMATMFQKCLIMTPYRLALKMIDEQGWILRNQIIWFKPNCMPSSVKDRFTVDYEPVFFFTKNKKYYFKQLFEGHISLGKPRQIGAKGANIGQQQARQGHLVTGYPQGRNKRCVWKISTKPFLEAHFATFPEDLVRPMIEAGCPSQICKKCGKAREEIYESKGYHFPQKDKDDKQHKAGVAISSYKSGPAYAKFREENPIEFKGLTDCGCNAGWDSGVV